MTKRTTTAPMIDRGDEDYNRIMAGLDEAKAIIEGTAPADSYQLHQVRVPGPVDVKAIRTKTGLTQEAFAERFGFTASAVRDWEQKRKDPILANRILLAVIAKRPDVIEEVLAA